MGIKKILQAVEFRRKSLNADLRVEHSYKIRMTSVDLKLTLKVAGVALKDLSPDHVIARMTPESQADFWKKRGLIERDWEGLAGQIFCDVFRSVYCMYILRIIVFAYEFR